MLPSSSVAKPAGLTSGYLLRNGSLLQDGSLLQGGSLLPGGSGWGSLLPGGSGWGSLLVREPRARAYPGRYMDLRRNFTFKRVFHTEVNKDLLIHFLNSLFGGRKIIEEVEFLPAERQGEEQAHRTVIYDILCKDSEGTYFLIEMQRAGQDYFEPRMLYYGCRLVSSQVPSGKAGDRYNIKEIFVIGILDFQLWADPALASAPALNQSRSQRYLRRVNMSWTDTHERFGPVEWIFIQLPLFDKPASKLNNDLDRWLYLMKHLGDTSGEPPRFEGPAFEKLYDLTAINNLTGEEFDMYMLTFDRESEWENTISYATRKGRQEGEKRGRQQHQIDTVQNLLKATDFNDAKIAMLAGTSERLVRQIRRRTCTR